MEPKDIEQITALRRAIESVILGKSEVVRLAVTALLARGHVLIEDIPGVGKTALARTLARSISCTFKRIQFTPDLLPGDVTGISVYDQERKDFVFKPGPVFAHVVLADEINRATPRTQSALLEAMNEAQVSVDGVTHRLSQPFMVIATQNPLEFTGTYPLPESQLDRFLMVLRIGYPTSREEREILVSRRFGDPIDDLSPTVAADDVRRLAELVQQVKMDEALTGYVVELAAKTRGEKSFLAGVSPRGAIHLARAAQAYALVDGRDYVVPDDVKAVALPVLSHRIMEKRARASADGRVSVQETLRRILGEVSVPQ
ncbi:MAG: MoxR family ATPase [Planctomycetes bacterium]|nr:MoxR family ATPase [Planctomycetota bacterium]